MTAAEKTAARNEAAANCTYHAAAAERYAAAAERFANTGNFHAAWGAIDTVKCASTLAMRAHEELWAAATGRLTDDEWVAFEAAEIAQTAAGRAFRAVEAASDARRAAATPAPRTSPYERTRAGVYATGNRWAIENFNATH